jgi:hypothetical protein
MSPLTIFLAIWLSSAVLVLIGGVWLLFRYRVEGEPSNADGFAPETGEHGGALPSEPGSAPRNARSAEPRLGTRERTLRSSILNGALK